MVASGLFRGDLYHRLNGFEICLPPLRNHAEDIPALANHFFAQGMTHAKRPLKGIAAEALALLRDAPWPGNARQLKNLVERGIAVAQGDYIMATDIGMMVTTEVSDVPQDSLSLLDAEKRHITEVFHRCKGDANEAARVLGLSRSTFYHKLKKFGIAPPEGRRT